MSPRPLISQLYAGDVDDTELSDAMYKGLIIALIAAVFRHAQKPPGWSALLPGQRNVVPTSTIITIASMEIMPAK